MWGEQARAGSVCFRPLLQNFRQVWLVHPVLGPLGQEKLQTSTASVNLYRKPLPSVGISSSKAAGPPKELKERLLELSVETLWDLLGSEIQEQVLSGGS